MTQDNYISGKKVLFVTTKNLDYIRIVQEKKILEEKAFRLKVIGSYSKHYPVRLLTVYLKLLATRISGYDTVFLGFAPQLVLPFWSWKFKKKDIVIDFFISFYDTICFDRRYIKADGLWGKLLYQLDQLTLERAQLVFCDTKAHGQYFIREFQVSPQKLFPLYLQADSAIYHPLNLERPAELRGKYIVLYFGSILPLQGVDIVLKAIERLKNEKVMHFFIIGPISDKKIKMLKPVSDHITYINWLPEEQLVKYIDMADLCLAGHFTASIQKAHRTIPGKAYIYHAMDKKMILGDNDANRELFEGDDKVTFVKMGDDLALAEAVLRNFLQYKGKY